MSRDKLYKLKEIEIDSLYDFLKESPGVPGGLVKPYLWESTQFNFIDILYTKSPDGAFENILYAYRLRNKLILEEWYSSENFLEVLQRIISETNGEILVSLGKKEIGEAFGWGLSDINRELRQNLSDRFEGAGSAEDFKDEYRAGSVELLAQDWWSMDEAENFVKVTTRNPQGVTKVILDRAQVVAFAHAMYDEKKAWMNSLFVDKEFRGKGLGGKILKGLVNGLVDKQVQVLYLGVDEGNKEAVDFYKRLGFEFTSFKKYQFRAKEQ